MSKNPRLQSTYKQKLQLQNCCSSARQGYHYDMYKVTVQHSVQLSYI